MIKIYIENVNLPLLYFLKEENGMLAKHAFVNAYMYEGKLNLF